MNANLIILLVEDDLDISESLQMILEEEKYHVICKYNGKEALEYLASTDELPSLILLDIMMPIMNGFDFRESQLQDSTIAEIPTILMSAGNMSQNIEKYHFTKLIKKPLELEPLLNTVKNYLE